MGYVLGYSTLIIGYKKINFKDDTFFAYTTFNRAYPWLPDGYSQFLRLYVFGPSGFWTMAPLRYAAKFDPFLSLDYARVESVGAPSNERKGSNSVIWQ